MTKKLISVVVLLFTCLVVYVGASTKNQNDLERKVNIEEEVEEKASEVEEQPNLEAVLKEAKENGYTVRLGTRYDADGGTRWLPPGKYRIVTDVIDYRAPGDFDKYYLAEEFEIMP